MLKPATPSCRASEVGTKMSSNPHVALAMYLAVHLNVTAMTWAGTKTAVNERSLNPQYSGDTDVESCMLG